MTHSFLSFTINSLAGVMLLCFLATVAAASAADGSKFSISNTLGSHAVLQNPVIIWGYGVPGESISTTVAQDQVGPTFTSEWSRKMDLLVAFSSTFFVPPTASPCQPVRCSLHTMHVPPLFTKPCFLLPSLPFPVAPKGTVQLCRRC